MYDVILVSHAGTPAGDLALEHAIHIAKSSSSHLIVLHVIEDFPHMPVFTLHASQVTKMKDEIAKMTKEMKILMEKELSNCIEMCKKNGVSSDLKVVIGTPADEILKILKNQKIDLIVMAKRRKLKGFNSLLTLGSVSRKIVESTSCPVLMVDAEEK